METHTFEIEEVSTKFMRVFTGNNYNVNEDSFIKEAATFLFNKTGRVYIHDGAPMSDCMYEYADFYTVAS